MASIITRRCIRCRKPLRDDGTCQNPNCVRYVPEDDNTDGDDQTNDTNKTENAKN